MPGFQSKFYFFSNARYFVVENTKQKQSHWLLMSSVSLSPFVMLVNRGDWEYFKHLKCIHFPPPQPKHLFIFQQHEPWEKKKSCYYILFSKWRSKHAAFIFATSNGCYLFNRWRQEAWSEKNFFYGLRCWTIFNKNNA